MHKTRSELPKNWPMPRKGTKYFVGSSHAPREGIPLQIVLRDILKVGKTRKEVRFMLLNKEISVNGKIRINKKFPIRVFDIVTLEKTKENYRLEITSKKLKLNKIDSKNSNKKTVKIIGKIKLSDKEFQINLEDGTNFIIKESFKTGGSAVLNLKENKIEKLLDMKKDSNVFIKAGKHSGKTGKIKEMMENRKCLIKFEKGETILPANMVLVVD